MLARNPGNTERSRSSILPTGFSGRSVSRGRASSSTIFAGRSARISSRTNTALFRHFHLLAQFVANALQALAHGRLVDAGVRSPVDAVLQPP